VAKRRLRERRHAACQCSLVGLNDRALAAHDHSILAEPLDGSQCNREGVCLAQDRVIAAGLDSRGERELLEELGHLHRGGIDHLDVAVGGRVELDGALERLHETVDGRERRTNVVARERDEAGERGIGWHETLRHSIGVTESTRQLPADLQASTPEVPLGLSRAGVTGVQKAVRIGRGAQEKLIAATIDCTVDLDPSQKGVHMSRFPELFEEAIEGVVADDAFLIEDLAEHVAARIVERQHAVVAEVQIRARYPYERTTPVTKLSTQEMVTLIGIAAASQTNVRRIVGVEAVGINACPCAQGLVKGHAAERLHEAGFGAHDVERILQLVPVATHNQRGQGTLLIGTKQRVNAERLVELVEQSMSSPIYELLKRPDELFVVEHAHLQPRFVEDSVRVALKSVLDEHPQLGDGDFVLSRQLNFETIHAHEVVAERYGTVGEVRTELRGGAHGPLRHSELRDWLRAASA
jgi:GTP cyclohydrolase-4